VVDQIKKGLEGVYALESSISFIDGKKGKLIYRGYTIEDLAKKSSFEEVIYLLWYGKLPNKTQLNSFKRKIVANRKIDANVIAVIKACPKNANAMDALHTADMMLGQCDPDLNDNSVEANIRKGTRLVAKFPTIVAAYWRIRQGKKIIQPKSGLSHGENFLYMLTGKKPSKEATKSIELDFLLTAEHGLNASTFATRVAISTLTDLHSAVGAGIATLKGPLHGGARKEVCKALQEVKLPKNAEKYVLDKVKKHQRVMGFGHRVYKAYDPRAKIFKAQLKTLAEASGNMKYYEIATKMEETVLREFVKKKGKPIYPNVDFFSGTIYKQLNIPIELSNAIFAIARIAGWTAHAIEQFSDNRLIRPRAKYIGKKGLKYR